MAHNYELIDRHGLPLKVMNTAYRDGVPFTILEILGPQMSPLTGEAYPDGSRWIRIRIQGGEVMEILDRASGCSNSP